MIRSLIPESATWTERAPCRGKDFFPSDSAQPSSLNVRQAKRTCIQCPFRLKCLELCYTPTPKWGLVQTSAGAAIGIVGWRTESEEGIWGGTTPAERKAVADLPVPERIALLMKWSLTATTGRWPVATQKEMEEAG